MRRATPIRTNQWIDQSTRTSLAGARAIVETEPDHPVIFLLNYADRYAAYGWAKTFTNVSRTGLPGEAVKRDFSYFGDVERFTELAAAGFPGDEAPTLLTDRTYNKISLGFYGELQAMAREYPEEPVVFLVRQFNEKTSSEEYLDSGASNLVPLSDDIAVVTGEGLVTPSDEAVAAASAAERETAAFYAEPPGPARQPPPQPAGDPGARDPAGGPGGVRRTVVRDRRDMDEGRPHPGDVDRADDHRRVRRGLRVAGPFGHTQDTLKGLFDGVSDETRLRITQGTFYELFPDVPPVPAETF